MKITCALSDFDFDSMASDLDVILYGKANKGSQGCIGGALKREVQRKKLVPEPRAWDFLSIALAVISADSAGHRQLSPDGWTRSFELTISVIDPEFWQKNSSVLQNLLAFLTTDIWRLYFIDGGILPTPPKSPIYPKEDSAALLSGGVDSLIGVIDLVAEGKKPYVVSQSVAPDTNRQSYFSKEIGEGLNSFQANHNVRIPNKERPQSQRARSIIFMAYGVLVATSLKTYKEGNNVPLHVCENGFISINPSLTTNRVGSLSTRTTHPVVIGLLQQVLNNANINVNIVNPYRHKTKGEMLKECKNQKLMSSLVGEATSCGRILTNKISGEYVHCGRCVPCMVRRSAFSVWKDDGDLTTYFYDDLSIQDAKHAGFDDVRSMLLAIADAKEQGIQRWLGASISSALVEDKDKLAEMIKRGLAEIEGFLNSQGVE